MNLTRSLLLGAALVAITASSAIAADPQSLTIKMVALNKSGENGTATLTQMPDGLHVVVKLKNAPKDVPQPTHIHIGTCGNINKAPEYALQNTVNGEATSVVPGVKLSDLMSAHYAVNVHKSGDDLGTYVSCGDVK
jgi:Cu/Zn superoxide dismutase